MGQGSAQTEGGEASVIRGLRLRMVRFGQSLRRASVCAPASAATMARRSYAMTGAPPQPSEWMYNYPVSGPPSRFPVSL